MERMRSRHHLCFALRLSVTARESIKCHIGATQVKDDLPFIYVEWTLRILK